MRAIHRLLATYTAIVILLVVLFSFVIIADNPTSEDIFSMVLSIAMFSLIPFGIIFLLWKHHKH